MKKIQLTHEPKATAGMLICKPVANVFEAFVDPDITTKFWFTRSTGKLEKGKKVTWTWDIYNVSAPVLVKSIEQNKRILIEWGDSGSTTVVEWIFTPHENGSTFVQITHSGFKGNGDEIVAQALDSLGGFTTVLDGAKAWLEHKINLHLIRDKFPKESKPS